MFRNSVLVFPDILNNYTILILFVNMFLSVPSILPIEKSTVDTDEYYSKFTVHQYLLLYISLSCRLSFSIFLAEHGSCSSNYYCIKNIDIVKGSFDFSFSWVFNWLVTEVIDFFKSNK